MPLPFKLTQKIKNLCFRFRGSKPESASKPKNFIRLCRRRTELNKIIIAAFETPDQKWGDDVIAKVIKYVLSGENEGVSVYCSNTTDPFDYVHALTVVAEGISQKDFRSTSEKRKRSKPRGSLIIPVHLLPKSTSYKFTPENNLNFYPANNYHFDLAITDSKEFAEFILSGIRQRTIKYSFLGNSNADIGSYRLQAAIAYSYCLQSFGELKPDVPPSVWADGKDIVASEQINTLMYLANTTQIEELGKASSSKK